MDDLLTAHELADRPREGSRHNAHVYAEYHRLAAEQAALRRVAALVARGVQPSEVFDAVTNEMRRCLRAVTAGLWRFETRGQITILAGAAPPAALAKWPVGTRTPIEGDTLAAV